MKIVLEALRLALESYLADVAGTRLPDGPTAERLREIRERVPAFARPRSA